MSGCYSSEEQEGNDERYPVLSLFQCSIVKLREGKWESRSFMKCAVFGEVQSVYNSGMLASSCTNMQALQGQIFHHKAAYQKA